MSSDTFHIEVRSIEGDTIELLCTTSTAGGLNDYAVTRSFVLMALQDGSDSGSPLQLALRELGGGDVPPIWKESFHQEHVGKFIASTELVERIGIIDNERAWGEGRFDESRPEEERQRAFPLHRFVLRARVTEPRWLEGIAVGDRYGTTSFDAWWEDPLRPTKAQMDAVERKALRWQPPQKAAAKKTAAPKKTAAKKTAAKKTAAKKTAAPKKTAIKKTAAPKKTAAKKTAASKKAAVKKTAAKKAR